MYVRRKIIKGHTYYYLVRGERHGKTVRQKVVQYLGKGPLKAERYDKEVRHKVLQFLGKEDRADAAPARTEMVRRELGTTDKGYGNDTALRSATGGAAKSTSTPKELEPLAQEARKFNTAEEFIESEYDTFFRGGKTPELGRTFGATWVSPTNDFASQYGEISELQIPKNLNLLYIEDPFTADELVSKHIGEQVEDTISTTDFWFQPDKDFIEFLKREGFDGFSNDLNFLIFDKSKIKTKSELTDFFNQVKGTTKSIPKELEPLAQEARKFDTAEELFQNTKEKIAAYWTQGEFSADELPGVFRKQMKDIEREVLRGKVGIIMHELAEIDAFKKKGIDPFTLAATGFGGISPALKANPEIHKFGIFAQQQLTDFFNQSKGRGKKKRKT